MSALLKQVVHVCLVQHGEQHADDDIQRQRLQSLRQQRLLHVAAITQDIADSLLALSDIRGMFTSVRHIH